MRWIAPVGAALALSATGCLDAFHPHGAAPTERDGGADREIVRATASAPSRAAVTADATAVEPGLDERVQAWAAQLSPGNPGSTQTPSPSQSAQTPTQWNPALLEQPSVAAAVHPPPPGGGPLGSGAPAASIDAARPQSHDGSRGERLDFGSTPAGADPAGLAASTGQSGAATAPRAPGFENLTVRPAAPVNQAVRAADPAAGPVQINAPQLAATGTTFNDLARIHAAQVRDESFRAQVDQRVLNVMAGEYEAARRPLDAVTAEQQAVAGRFIETLIALREMHGGDPTTETSRLHDTVKQLYDALEDAADPRITTLQLCRAVHGFGQYEAIEPAVFAAGRANQFVAYVELRDFASEATASGEYESRFSMKTLVLEPAGKTVLELADDPIVDRCKARRRDCFIPRLVTLPATLGAGSYVVKVSVVDKIARKVAEGRADFRVVAAP